METRKALNLFEHHRCNCALKNQTSVHYIWRERNRRRHGEQGSSHCLLTKLIEKTGGIRSMKEDCSFGLEQDKLGCPSRSES
ncbi:hypothetical protein YC2023_112821 [Brassica napus]